MGRSSTLDRGNSPSLKDIARCSELLALGGVFEGQSGGQLTGDEQELLELYHDLSDAERESMLGFLRAIHNTRTAPPLPDLEKLD